MRPKRIRIMLGSTAVAVALLAAPSSSSAMTCAPDFEAICYAIGASCHAVEQVEEKILKKDLVLCQFG